MLEEAILPTPPMLEEAILPTPPMLEEAILPMSVATSVMWVEEVVLAAT